MRILLLRVRTLSIGPARLNNLLHVQCAAPINDKPTVHLWGTCMVPMLQCISLLLAQADIAAVLSDVAFGGVMRTTLYVHRMCLAAASFD